MRNCNQIVQRLHKRLKNEEARADSLEEEES